MSFSKRYCDVIAGRNTCHICQETAWYSLRIPQPKHKTFPRMELLRCGHGMCQNCYDTHTHNSDFECPFCRNGPTYVATFGEIINKKPLTKTINTINEYAYEWRNFIDRAMLSTHAFAILHKQICHDYKEYKEMKQLEREKEIKIKNAKAKRDARALDKEKAFCHICGKNKFTSTKQLSIHIKAKH